MVMNDRQPFTFAGLLGVILVAFSLVSMWKENCFGWPLRGVIWFTVAIIGSCAVIALLAGYVQKARSLEKVYHRVEAVTFGLE
jgi:predicted ferric reductase